MNYAILSSSLWRDYQFGVVIAARMWRELINFEPYILLVGSASEWRAGKRSAVVLAALEALDCRIEFVPHIEEFSDPTIAQNCRQYASALPFRSEDYLLLSDADLWVFNRAWIQRRDSSKTLTSWYSNGDMGQSLPTCHLGASAQTWRELISIEPNGDIASTMRQPLLNWLEENRNRHPDKNMTVWCMDQWRTTDRIKTVTWYPDEVQFIERFGHPPADRLDRNNWPAEYDASRFIDAHIFKGPDSHPSEPNLKENWPRLRELIRRVLPVRLEWAERFRDEFLKSY
jgi:hypothetical protein